MNTSEDIPTILLHGLARTARCMVPMELALSEVGHDVHNIAYPSRHHSIETLSREYVLPAIRDAQDHDEQPVNIVSHSLGGIITRYLAAHTDLNVHRAVMLAPPSQGSEVVDKLKNWPLFRWLNGPAGQQLGTLADDMPASLGAVDFEAGVITGRRSINWILSTMIEGENDGKVSVERAKLPGMAAFLVVEAAHPLIMKNGDAIQATIDFLEQGEF